MKPETGNRKPETGNRKPETGNRKPETGNRKPVFGLSPEWLFDGDRLIPSSLVLSHPEQVERLVATCPRAAEVAVLAGDTCLDRMSASVALRPSYRRALGCAEDHRLVLISSTWGPDSLFGAHPDLVSRLVARLPIDDFRVVLSLHPNIVHRHAPWQIDRWSQAWRRAGVTVLPPEEGWRAAVVAADVVVGDHGSVTFYGAALGRPVLLASAPRHAVAPDSAVGRFLTAAPLYDHRRPPAAQLTEAITTHDPTEEPLASITALATSAPGQAAALLRSELYRLIELDEPAEPAGTRAVPIPTAVTTPPGAQVVLAEPHGADVRITRYPAELMNVDGRLPPGCHLRVDLHEPQRRMLDLAEIVVVPDGRDAAAVLASMPGCLLATGPVGTDRWLVTDTDGATLLFRGTIDDGAVWASVLHAWLDAGHSHTDLPDRLSATVGRRRYTATVERG
ncbi:hypothetical protein [Herbihabitans rhizosphaerae]|uniref:hypothetical protein n=1 Tax=Herbihabitans rhizosphaerae TaxID=1872711 RepID=UPI00102AF644|nr:hypothetical protein [Herbihabitans rhizosphaerae]